MSWFKSVDKVVTKRNSTLLLVIAHPDDEVMFFSPLLNFTNSIHILCLSDGNDEGLGTLRREELFKCGEFFSVKKENITIVRHPQLVDGMRTNWPSEIVSEIVLNHMKLVEPDIVRFLLSQVSFVFLNFNL
jgi:N-acetylglucosaminylphosphatidylinositol deacetylase